MGAASFSPWFVRGFVRCLVAGSPPCPKFPLTFIFLVWCFPPPSTWVASSHWTEPATDDDLSLLDTHSTRQASSIPSRRSGIASLRLCVSMLPFLFGADRYTRDDTWAATHFLLLCCLLTGFADVSRRWKSSQDFVGNASSGEYWNLLDSWDFAVGFRETMDTYRRTEH